MNNITESFLACRHCRQLSPFGFSERVRFLRRLGLLRRVKDPEPQIVAELFALRLPQLPCPDCGACGLQPAGDDAVNDPEEDPEFWGERRRCSSCGVELAAERLEVLPDALRCAPCEAAVDASEADEDYCERCGSIMNLVSSNRRTAGYVLRCPQCGPVRPSLLLLVVLFSFALAVGCGQTDGNSTAEVATVEQTAPQEAARPSFAELVERVAAGDATKIQTDQPLEDAALQELRGLTALETLRLDGGRVTDAGVEHLTDLPNLTELRMRLSPVTDAAAERIASLGNLRILNLPHSQWTSAAIEHLEDVESLRQLRLGSSRADADIADAIARLDQLTSVHLIDIPLTSDALQSLAAMPHLQSLYIDGADLPDEAWVSVFEEHPHLHLHVDQAHLDRDPNPHRH